jgi:hypothetical protein
MRLVTARSERERDEGIEPVGLPHLRGNAPSGEYGYDES